MASKRNFCRLANFILAAALGFILILLVTSCDSSASQNSTRVGESVGLWTISDMGYPEEVFTCTEEKESKTVQFILPDDATQGPSLWYVLRLKFEINFSESTEDGICYVSADTNGFTCAQIKFIVRREGGDVVIDWQTNGLINGPEHYSETGGNVSVSFSNYLRTAGVKPGLNSLTFKFENLGNVATVDSLRILGNTAIECTAVGF